MDIYGVVTDRIIAELEAGVIPWERPWTGVSDGAIRRSNGEPYSLINQMLLGKPGEYVTFKQCKEEGGHVKKGAKAGMVIFWKIMHRAKKDEDGNVLRDKEGKIVDDPLPVLRYYNVFHIDDCEGLEPKYGKDRMPDVASPDQQAEQIIGDYVERSKVTIEHSIQNRAFYSPSRHLVSLPVMQQFKDSAGYYETTFHELTHSTGHKSLLNRFTESAGAAAFGSESYSKEELVAEIGACCLLHRLGMETGKSFRNNAAYIQNWLSVLKNDKRMIISAAGKAEKAVRLILGEEEKENADENGLSPVL